MTYTKLRVGISLRVQHIEQYDEYRDALSQDWISFFNKQEILPILIPNTLENIDSFLKEMQVDVLILSGGDNIGDNPERDMTEKILIEYSLTNNVPLLGVCRGMQAINNFFGGSIILNDNDNHVRKTHKIKLIESENFFQNNLFTVNSFHNNLITQKTLGDKLNILAISTDDSTVEAFSHSEFPIIGVMWHPERDKNISTGVSLMKILQNKSIWLN